MRTHLQALAILLASLDSVVAQNAESPTTPSSNPPEQPQSVTPSVPRTGGPSDHCAILAKPPNPNNVAMDRNKNHVSGGRLIKRVNASYPAAARQAHIQGTVVLCATISKDGVVQNVHPLFGAQELIPAAVEAAEQWRYEPYRVKKDQWKWRLRSVWTSPCLGKRYTGVQQQSFVLVISPFHSLTGTGIGESSMSVMACFQQPSLNS